MATSWALRSLCTGHVCKCHKGECHKNLVLREAKGSDAQERSWMPLKCPRLPSQFPQTQHLKTVNVCHFAPCLWIGSQEAAAGRLAGAMSSDQDEGTPPKVALPGCGWQASIPHCGVLSAGPLARFHHTAWPPSSHLAARPPPWSFLLPVRHGSPLWRGHRVTEA